MDKATARKLADALTWSRVFSIVPLTALAWYDLRGWFLGVYAVAALTDLADGWFGRRAAPPKSDADLDGNADLVFTIMTLAWIWMFVPGFFEKYWFPYLPLLKWPGLHSPHLQFNRVAMGIFCLLLPFLIVFGDRTWFVHAVLVVGTLGKLRLAWYFATADKSRLSDKEVSNAS
jgi:hypothetical protein